MGEPLVDGSGHVAPFAIEGPSLGRRGFLKLASLAIYGTAFVGLPYVILIEPYWVVVERRHLVFPSSARSPGGLRIAHVSDIHRSSIVSDTFLERAFEQLSALEPDLVFLTGDFITREEDTRNPEGYVRALRKLRARLGVFASLGNHDGGGWAEFPTTAMLDILSKAGVRTLVNETVALEDRGRRFAITGLADAWSGEFDVARAYATHPGDVFTFLLSHNPDTLPKFAGRPGHLMLSGHTHGGQVWIPFYGPPIVPVFDRRHVAGLYEDGGRLLYVNRGLGLLKQVRFNCPPEIAIFEIGSPPAA